ncbi:hypothetical protein BDK51DRAFT_25765 [Blyttiomyces helicus]|uniref:Uncharacterized protein n=1 Tax=Blyttiomyces helicus TaxID=388810 RepID=A0A4P9WAP3_9FUNG|nr:hypothetical protein BDK51DRAFT_25765 [Blyttiomyces helicus]|eukprot:RKO87940.1 hypothetical protein BDK51DRAFT_25765 [Blyttiomyces helicus]
MLAKVPSGRLSLSELPGHPHFNNILISTIKYLDSFPEKTQMQKAQFLKGLVRVLPQFSDRLLHRKILPALLQNLKDHVMSPFLLPPIFWISERMGDADFVAKVLPSLKPVFRMTDPPQAIILMVSRVDLLLKKCGSGDLFKQDVMPLIYGALEISVPQVQEQALKAVPLVLERLDFTAMKSVLFPKIHTLCLSSTILSVKVSSLIAIHSLVKVLDKFTLVEKVIPLLKANKVREPGIIVAILAVYESLAKVLEKEILAAEILPELWKLCLDPVLNPKQFKRFMSVINDLSKKIEEQHLKHLEEMTHMEAPASKPGSDSIQDFAKLINNAPAGSTALDDPDNPFLSQTPPPQSRPAVAATPPPMPARPPATEPPRLQPIPGPSAPSSLPPAGQMRFGITAAPTLPASSSSSSTGGFATDWGGGAGAGSAAAGYRGGAQTGMGMSMGQGIGRGGGQVMGMGQKMGVQGGAGTSSLGMMGMGAPQNGFGQVNGGFGQTQGPSNGFANFGAMQQQQQPAANAAPPGFSGFGTALVPTAATGMPAPNGQEAGVVICCAGAVAAPPPPPPLLPRAPLRAPRPPPLPPQPPPRPRPRPRPRAGVLMSNRGGKSHRVENGVMVQARVPRGSPTGDTSQSRLSSQP